MLSEGWGGEVGEGKGGERKFGEDEGGLGGGRGKGWEHILISLSLSLSLLRGNKRTRGNKYHKVE